MKAKSKSAGARAVPKRFREFGRRYPAIAAAYESLAKATQEAGPLDTKARCLVKLGIAAGAWREGAVHSHTRRALDAGCTPEEIRHVVLLATTTLGFPSMMAVMTWVEDVLSRPSFGEESGRRLSARVSVR
jgi:alkylhydroperoxidase/carboxymuconolactone decarboxylase family protein YurZ